MKALFCSLMILGLLCFVNSVDAQQPKAKKTDLTKSKLVILEPVPINNPPIVQRVVNTGEIIQLQISYPVIPNLPNKASMKASTKGMKALMIVSTNGRVEAIQGMPKPGVVGINYFSAYVRAVSKGNCIITITAEYPNGQTKDVVFSFTVK